MSLHYPLRYQIYATKNTSRKTIIYIPISFSKIEFLYLILTD